MGVMLAEIGFELSDSSLRSSFIQWLGRYFHSLPGSVAHIDYESIEISTDPRSPEELKVKVQINGDSFATAKKDADLFINQLISDAQKEFFKKTASTSESIDVFGQTLVAA